MALIKTTIIRAGGSVHTDNLGREHHFKPNERGQHVCEITDPATISLFLKANGFELYDETATEDLTAEALTAKILRVTVPGKVSVESNPVVTVPVDDSTVGIDDPEILAALGLGEDVQAAPESELSVGEDGLPAVTVVNEDATPDLIVRSPDGTDFNISEMGTKDAIAFARNTLGMKFAGTPKREAVMKLVSDWIAEQSKPAE